MQGKEAVEQQKAEQVQQQQQQQQQHPPPHLHAEVDQAIARLRQQMGSAAGPTTEQVRRLESLEEQKRMVNRRWVAKHEVERIGQQLAALRNQLRSEARALTPDLQQQVSQLEHALQRARL